MKKLCVTIGLALVLFSGCSIKSKTAIPLCRVVTQVDVQWIHEDAPRHYTLTSMDEIQPVLIYLRTLRPVGQPAVDPERLDADSWKIVIHRSDGSQRVYRQQGEEYLSRDSSPWNLIDAAKGSRLALLFQDEKGEDF